MFLDSLASIECKDGYMRMLRTGRSKIMVFYGLVLQILSVGNHYLELVIFLRRKVFLNRKSGSFNSAVGTQYHRSVSTVVLVSASMLRSASNILVAIDGCKPGVILWAVSDKVEILAFFLCRATCSYIPVLVVWRVVIYAAIQT